MQIKKNSSLTPMPIFSRTPSQLRDEPTNRSIGMSIPVRAHQTSQDPSFPPSLPFFLREPGLLTRALTLSSRFFCPFRSRSWASKIFFCVKDWVRTGSFCALALFAFLSCRCRFFAGCSSAPFTTMVGSEPGRLSGESRTPAFLFWPRELGIEGSGRRFGMSRGLLPRDEAP